MLGLTPFGAFHTALSLVAVAAALVALARDGRISGRNTVGKVYVITTLATAVTALFIFHHGGFGKPHVLAIATIVALGVAWAAENRSTFGRWSAYVAAVTYSATVLFHFIPAITETTTRLPLDHPLLPGPDAPELQIATAVLGVLFLIGAFFQVRALRAGRAHASV